MKSESFMERYMLMLTDEVQPTRYGVDMILTVG